MNISVGRSLLWALGYGAAVLVGRSTTLPETGLALFWPAAGMAVLWLLGSRAAGWHLDVVLLFVTTVVVNVALGVTVVPAVVFGLANVTVGMSACAVLTRSVGDEDEESDSTRPALTSTRGVIALAGAALVAGVLSAPFGVLAGQLLTGGASWLGALAWSVRNATGVFVVAGVALSVATARTMRGRGRSWSSLLTNDARPHAVTELVLATAGVATTVGLVFGVNHGLPIAFVPVAVAALIGFRFAPVVSAVMSTAAGVFAIAATLAGSGPFGGIDDPTNSALVVQAFVLTQAAISLTLSWAVAERHVLTFELEAARDEASERAQLLDAVTDTLAHGVAVIDGDGRVLVRNEAARALVPGPEGTIEPDQPEAYGVRRVDGEPMSLAAMPHTMALGRGEVVDAELVVARPGSDMTFVSVRAEPLELNGRIAKRVAVISIQDITAHKEQVRQLESFAAVVAHDLRSPLTALTMWSDMLDAHLRDQDILDSVAEEAFEHIHRAGGRMTTLIEDLLAYATASSAPLHSEQVDLDRLVEELAAEVRAAGPVAPDIAAQRLGTLHADPVLLRQILANLIGNAVKYVEDGLRPRVRIAAERTGGSTVLTIVDNGVGIPPDMRTKVFEGFTRVRSTSVSRPGTGLGLAICARAVERHNGTITAGPAPDGGTTITVVFPDLP